MKISALEEYGIRCMLMFARKNNGKPLTLPIISRSESLSVPYAAKLLMILKKAGLVKAVRGRNGGYILSRPANEIALKDVFEALGDSFFGQHHCARYSGDTSCVHNEDCPVRSMWSSFDSYISSIIKNVTLADLASGQFDFDQIANKAI
jgi:Rrf2 family transcriptional regulator, iron-sulfur cluster assembly transcription factor